MRQAGLLTCCVCPGYIPNQVVVSGVDGWGGRGGFESVLELVSRAIVVETCIYLVLLVLAFSRSGKKSGLCLI